MTTPTRHRSKNYPKGYTYYGKYATPYGGVKAPFGTKNGDYLTYEESETISDIVTPGYAELKAKGLIVNSPMSYVHSTFFESEGSYLAARSGGTEYEAYGPQITVGPLGTNGAWFNLPSLDSTSIIADAKQKCIADINSTPYSFAEDTLETAQTLRFLKNPGKSLLKLAEDTKKQAWRIRKKKGAKARQVADALNDLYLSREYAIKPLVMSSFDAIDALNEKLDHNAERYTARGFSEGEESYDNDDFRQYYNATVYDKFAIHNSIKVSVHAYCLYTHREQRGVLHKYGIRGDDGLVGLWNIVPLSFMVDQMYNISGLIQGITALSDPRMKIQACGIVVKTKIKGKCSWLEQNNPPWTCTVSGTQERESFTMTRGVDWYPSIADTIPVFRPSNLVRDAKSIANLFSLSAGIFSRSLKPDRY